MFPFLKSLSISNASFRVHVLIASSHELANGVDGNMIYFSFSYLEDANNVI